MIASVTLIRIRGRFVVANPTQPRNQPAGERQSDSESGLHNDSL